MTDSSSQKKLTYDDVINKDILELMGVADLSDKAKKPLYQKMLSTIQNRVIARISDKLNDSEISELRKLLDTGDQKALNDFFAKKGIDLPKLMLEEALIYKTELATLAQGK